MYTKSILKLAKNLQTQYESIFSHKGNVGDSREKFVIEFLRKVNPERYGFSKGEVFDQQENSCGEVDIIIYDKLFSTVFTDGTEKILAPIESTFGIIEVKSTLTTSSGNSPGTLEQSIEKLRKYNELNRPEASDNTQYILPDVFLSGGRGITFSRTNNTRINGIFAFKNNVAIETLKAKVKEANFIDFVVVPNELFIFGRTRDNASAFDFLNQPISNFLSKSENAIATWIIYLQIMLSRSRLVGLDKKDLLVGLVQNSEIHL